jgi:hypothetical protein
MGAILATLTASLLLHPAPADTINPFASAATQALVERAMERQRTQDSLVTDYTATLRYRLTVSLGRRRWARSAPASVEEQDVKVQWQAPNDLRVDVLGRRAAAVSPELGRESWSIWDRPWFVPRGLSDSIRIFSDEFPAIAPLHPLAGEGPRWYRYELTDSAQVTLPNGKRVKVLAVDVTPAREGPALIVGRLWIDAATSETVRFAFRYVGKGLWVAPEGETRKDSSNARRANGFINRLFTLDVDLEYGIQDGQYWMPWRQTISGRVSVPLVSDLVIPFEAVTTFRNYEINTGKAPAFTLEAPVGMSRDSALARWRARQDTLRKARRSGDIPDSLWARDYAGFWQDGRYEVHRPPKDSLARYEAWGDSLVLASDPEDAGRVRDIEAELGRMAEGLPDDLTGNKPVRFAMQRPGDLAGFNRVQGWSLGAGIGVKVPGVSFTDAYGTLRYGFSDERVTGRLGVIRNGPGWKLTVDGYRDIVDQDPVSPGRNIANSLNAVFTTHDNADYMLATGGGAAMQLPWTESLELKFGLKVEEQLTVERDARSGLNDFLGGTGVMLENAPITDGTFVGGFASVSGRGRLRWTLSGDVLSGAGTETGRVWGEAQYAVGRSSGATFRTKAGIASSPTLPQMQFRVGGQQTVRMYDYGRQRGQAFWAGQVDVAPFSGWLRPVVFADVGWAGDASDIGDSPLFGAGVGLSLYSKLFRAGVIRFDLSRGLSPDHPTLRFDIVFQAVR